MHLSALVRINKTNNQMPFQLPISFASVPCGRYCLMGHKGRVAILCVELPRGGAKIRAGACPGYPDPQASVARHNGVYTVCATAVDLGGE